MLAQKVYWFAINGLFVIATLVGGFGSGEIAQFSSNFVSGAITLFLIFNALSLIVVNNPEVSQQYYANCTEIPQRSMPEKIDNMYDMSYMLLLVAVGWYWTIFFYFVMMVLQSEVQKKVYDSKNYPHLNPATYH